MKKTVLSAMGLTALLSAAPAYSAVILRYNMETAAPTIEDPVNGADGGAITNGGGLSQLIIPSTTGAYTTTPVLQAFPTAGDASKNATDAFANNSFFTFTLTVGSNVQDLDLTSLTFDAARGGASTERGFAIRVDSPTTADEEVQGSTLVPTVRSTFTNFDIPLSLASLQNLTAGDVVTFEIAVFAPTTGNSVEFDNLIVNGDVTIPEPSTVAMAGLGLAALGFRRRRA